MSFAFALLVYTMGIFIIIALGSSTGMHLWQTILVLLVGLFIALVGGFGLYVWGRESS